MTENFSSTAAFIWSVADLLRGDFKQSQYGRIILPFTLLRRLECVLADKKDAIVAKHDEVKAMPADAQEQILKHVADLSFYNTSRMDLNHASQSGDGTSSGDRDRLEIEIENGVTMRWRSK